MTRDEVRELIAATVNECIGLRWSQRAEIADAVLAA